LPVLAVADQLWSCRPVLGGPTACSDASCLHAAKLLLELPDLVPEPGGELELQLGRRGVHLIGQRCDQGDQVLSRGTCALVSLGATDSARGGCRPRTRGRARDRSLAAALPTAGTAKQLVSVGVLASELVGDVRDALAQRLGIDAALEVVGD